MFNQLLYIWYKILLIYKNFSLKIIPIFRIFDECERLTSIRIYLPALNEYMKVNNSAYIIHTFAIAASRKQLTWVLKYSI